MASGGQQIAIFGLLGVGGYLFYEYSQYNSAVTTFSSNYGGAGSTQAAQAAAAIQQTLPFMTYLSMKWGGTGTSNQLSTYNMLLTPATAPAAMTPGTTPTMVQGGGQTSVSTAPGSTTATPSSLQTLAANMQNAIGVTVSTADNWNAAFTHVMGQGIDTKFGIQFDTVYGPVANGVRNNGATMSALMFLQLAAASLPAGLPGLSGMGQIARFPGRMVTTQGNLLYQAHHPTPYNPSFSLKGMRGLGALTQATGFEKVLWANRSLRSNRVP